MDEKVHYVSFGSAKRTADIFSAFLLNVCPPDNQLLVSTVTGVGVREDASEHRSQSSDLVSGASDFQPVNCAQL